ncbi:MAG: hypothetical protein ABH846_01725 [Patescibacteria group bacterium]
MRKILVWVNPYTGERTPAEQPESMSDEVWGSVQEAVATGAGSTALFIFMDHFEMPVDWQGYFLAYDKPD